MKPPLCCVSAAAMAACCEALWLLTRGCLTLLGSVNSSSRDGAGLGRGTSAPLRICRSSCGKCCMLQSACIQKLSQHPWLTIPEHLHRPPQGCANVSFRNVEKVFCYQRGEVQKLCRNRGEGGSLT